MTTLTQNPIDAQASLERIPPHSIEAEMSLLGALLLDRDAITEILPIIGREESRWFYRPNHEQLFRAVVDIYDNNKPVDVITLPEELQQRDLLEQIGGVSYLVTLAESVPSAANAEHYARILREKGMLRELIRCSGEICDAAYATNRPVAEVFDDVEQKFFRVTERRVAHQSEKLTSLLEAVYRRLEARGDKYISGLRSGFTELDDLTSGFQPGDFIIVAGRPSMGKTAFGLTVAEHMAVDDHAPVVFFSMEMSNQQVAQRILCSRGRIDSHRFRKGMLSEQDIHTLGGVCEFLAQAPMYVDDTPGMTVMQLRASVRRHVRKHDVKAVFVDYVQLMSSPGANNRQEELATISRGLKSIGRELNIPIITMAQLNRQAEGREGHRPRMSDLRESGALEQDADVVLLLHREEYYKPQNIEAHGVADVIIAKQRNGPIGDIKLHFDKRLTRFDNLSVVPEPEYVAAGQDTPF